ncbi:unnamed protein product [Durusdinium trenchii]|uniref:Integrase catalytic domain-containing protein n=1 Tax=Durusdinium trenchii TaxID=1381693 RepID=A0ABP0R7H0_9DINO
MRYDLTAKDSEMDGHMTHGWTQQEIAAAQEGGFMTPEKMRRLNWEVQGDLRQDEEDLLKGPQVARQAKLRGHRAATSMSLESGWDFQKAEDRKACIRKVMEEDPFCLVLAFPCGPWSPLTRLRASSTLDERRQQGRVLLNFALLLARIRMKRGAHVLLENPRCSLAWSLPELAQFVEQPNIECVDFDQCAFKLRSVDGLLHKKPTRIATSSSCIADELQGMVCSRDHAHQPVIGGSKITSRAGHYPVALAKAIVRGLEKQFHVDHGRCREVLAVDGAEEERSDDGGDSVMDPFNSESEISSMDEEGSSETKIPSAIRLAVKRLRTLDTALVLSGAPKEVVLAAKSLKCSICDEKKRPKSRRPTSLPTPKDVSDQVHLDIFESVDVSEQRFYIVHCIDWTSRFQMAEVLETKDSDSIVNWFQERWMSIFGPPRVIVADQGREFVSWVFQEMCDRHSILLHHIPVQAPWCNGVCERGGGILKGLLECCVKSRSVAGLADMKVALQECVLAYNADINELGVSPAQAAIGRQPRMIGDVLGNFGQRLAEHGLIDGRPSLARQVALRETARIAMTRLHFSKWIRKAELARSRSSTMTQQLEPGDIVYFWREPKYNSRTSPSKKRLSLRRWRGPALLVALEGHNAGYVSFKGQLSKQISADVIQALDGSRLDFGSELPASNLSRRASAMSSAARAHSRQSSGAAPGTPVPALITGASQVPGTPPLSSRMEESVEAARELEAMGRKRAAELEAETLREGSGFEAHVATTVLKSILKTKNDLVSQYAKAHKNDSPVEPQSPHYVDTLEADIRDGLMHPLKAIQQQVDRDKQSPELVEVQDHGSWSGQWPLPSRSSWMAHETCCALWPSGGHEVNAAKTARREVKWRNIPLHERDAYRQAAETGWKVQTDNGAFEILTDAEAHKVRARLKAAGQLNKILTPRYIYTDKNDGLRSDSNPLPLLANARVVIPGYQDETAYAVRKDAPTSSRCSQHILFITAAAKGWTLWSADVKSAFLKGELFQEGERELYIGNIRATSPDEPLLPFSPHGLAKVRKGVFGLADSPRRWYLRLNKSLTKLGWLRSSMDAAQWFLKSPDGTLDGIVVSHVDDLLRAGTAKAHATLKALGEELGFGSLETGSFTYCGKLVQQLPEKSIEVSVRAYHENMQPVSVPIHRKKQLDAQLTPSEHRQFDNELQAEWRILEDKVRDGKLEKIGGEKCDSAVRLSQCIRAFAVLGKSQLSPAQLAAAQLVQGDWSGSQGRAQLAKVLELASQNSEWALGQEEEVQEKSVAPDECIVFRQLRERKGGAGPTGGMDDDEDFHAARGATIAQAAADGALFAERLAKVQQMTGLADPVYVEAFLQVHSFDLMLELLVVNRTNETLQNVLVELSTQGDLKLVDRPSAVTLSAGQQMTLHASIKVASTETGIIFGYVTFEKKSAADKECSVLNELHVDILDYIERSWINELAFRTMWSEFEWENKVNINTSITEVGTFLEHIMRNTNMSIVGSEKNQKKGKLTAEDVQDMLRDADALANISIEKLPDGKLTGGTASRWNDGVLIPKSRSRSFFWAVVHWGRKEDSIKKKSQAKQNT